MSFSFFVSLVLFCMVFLQSDILDDHSKTTYMNAGFKQAHTSKVKVEDEHHPQVCCKQCCLSCYSKNAGWEASTINLHRRVLMGTVLYCVLHHYWQRSPGLSCFFKDSDVNLHWHHVNVPGKNWSETATAISQRLKFPSKRFLQKSLGI